MSSYKLYYYDGRGFAEPIRMILSYGGIGFEDIRIPTDNPLPQEIKEKCTWGQVPLIEFGDGKKLAQSLAITRYFAKKFNLVPADDFEAAECDEYVDSCRDFFNLWIPLFMEQDEEKVKERLVQVKKVAHETFLTKFNQIIEDNGGLFLVGKKLTWADIYLAHVLNTVDVGYIHKWKLGNEYPGLISHSENVFNVPQIKKWVEIRPKTKC